MREKRELKEMIQYGQRLLRVKDDGIIGERTMIAINRVAQLRSEININWTFERKLIAIIQIKAIAKNIQTGRIDGLLGTQTRFAFEQLRYLEKFSVLPDTWRDEDNALPHNQSIGRTINPHDFPKYKDIKSFYGKPTRNLKTVKIPYTMRLAWDTSVKVNKITCHKKVANSLVGILEDVRDYYSLEQLTALGIDLYGGCFNHRKMRGGKQLSTHSWAVAIDLDPARNQLRWNHTRAQFAKPSYEFLLTAFAGDGWVSLGEAKDYDWMHFQAVRV